MNKRRFAIIVLLTLLLIAAGQFAKSQITSADQTYPESHISVEGMHRLVNAERAKVGAKQLVLDERLNQSAEYKAKDMLSRGYFGHEDPKTKVFNGLIYAQGVIKCQVHGENLTQNTKRNDSLSAVKAWYKSKGHREAMLDPKFEGVGYGVAGNYVVQHFCDIM